MVNYEITGHVPLFFIDADDKYYYESIPVMNNNGL